MKSIFTCFFLIASLFASAQCLLKEIPLDQRTKQSELIVEGRVSATRSFWNTAHNMIYTSNTIEVLKIFKGNISGSSVDIVSEGGTVGYYQIRVDPSLKLSKGQTGIFMCQPAKRFKGLPANNRNAAQYEVFGAVQGFLKYNLNDGTASDPFTKYENIKNELYRSFSPLMNYKVIKAFDIPTHQNETARIQAITSFSPSTVTAGTGTILTINGSGFGATRGSGSVGFKWGDDGGASYINPLVTQYVSWSNTQIRVEVPSAAATGTIQVTQGSVFTSASTLTVDYAHLNVDFDPGSGLTSYQTDHIDNNGSGGYTWQMNTAFDANSPARASFMRAFNSWRCGSFVNWTIGANTAVDDAIGDGTNVITFDDAAPLPGGVLGVCYSYWSGCASGLTIQWFVDELDIIFDNGDNFAPLTWEFGTANPSGSEYDFESVALHELGHGHQLGHVIDVGAVMHFALFNGATSRILSSEDLAGGGFVQAKSVVANVCGPGPMTAFAGCGTLPITIATINAFEKGLGVQVEWVNASETDVDHYVVEESANGSVFADAVSVFPRSNNGGRTSYEWFDANVSNGNNYYRIKSIGLNGDIKYSSVVTVNFEVTGKTFSVYPNPVSGGILTASFNNLAKGKYTLSIYNTAGQQVMTRSLVHGGGNAVEYIRLPGVATGVYNVRLQGNTVRLQQTVLVRAEQ